MSKQPMMDFSVGAYSLLPFAELAPSGFACVTYWRHCGNSPLRICINVGISHNNGKLQSVNSHQLFEDDFLASHPFFTDEELRELNVHPGDVITLRRTSPSSWCDAASVYMGSITPIGLFPTHDVLAKNIVDCFVQGREVEVTRMLWGLWERARKEKSSTHRLLFYPANLGGMTLSAKESASTGSIGGMA